jgi:hypothetical protein
MNDSTKKLVGFLVVVIAVLAVVAVFLYQRVEQLSSAKTPKGLAGFAQLPPEKV